jgi:hypothetical protein
MHRHTQTYTILEIMKAAVFPVLASEEYKAPYVAIVKSGEAIIMKQILVVMYVPGGKKVCIILFVYKLYTT